MITADLMSRITLFAKVPEDERASLAARAADLHLRKDEWLLVEGQAPGFYGLIEGHIDVLKVLGDYGFEILESNRYDGRIETFPRTAPGLGLFMKPGSPDVRELLGRF